VKVFSVTRDARWARQILAVRASAAAWVVLAAVNFGLVMLPGTDRSHMGVILALTFFALFWAALTMAVPARRVLHFMFPIGTVASIAIHPIAIAATGGSLSPLRVMPMLTVVYCCWFYDAKPAGFIACIVASLNLAPLAYDSHAFEAQHLGQTIALAAVFLVVAGVMIAARRELIRLRNAARADARRDPLTELANRRALMNFLEKARGDVGVLLFDLDGLKVINTMHGHTAGGDAAIKATAAALRSAVRPGDLVARFGGDEFAVVALGVDRVELRRLAERALAAVSGATDELSLSGVELAASAGAALMPGDADTIDGVLRAADLALGRAKRAGKGCVVAAPEASLVHA
jgi:diguanylate cyclase (GGDEF)-like protein